MRLLLDENCPRGLAEVLAREAPEMAVLRLQDWHGGRFMGRGDREILSAAAADGLVLFTFDVSTIPAVLAELAVSGQSHGGVVFASGKRVPRSAYAAFAHALARLWHAERAADWTNRVLFLPVTSRM